MPSLRDIRKRIVSVKNTQKITKAMKMVAAAKLRRAQDAITRARPYAQLLDALRAEGSMLASIRDKREIVKETDDKLKAFLTDFTKKFA